jgi:hypothetical protein
MGFKPKGTARRVNIWRAALSEMVSLSLPCSLDLSSHRVSIIPRSLRPITPEAAYIGSGKKLFAAINTKSNWRIRQEVLQPQNCRQRPPYMRG